MSKRTVLRRWQAKKVKLSIGWIKEWTWIICVLEEVEWTRLEWRVGHFGKVVVEVERWHLSIN